MWELFGWLDGKVTLSPWSVDFWWHWFLAVVMWEFGKLLYNKIFFRVYRIDKHTRVILRKGDLHKLPYGVRKRLH